MGDLRNGLLAAITIGALGAASATPAKAQGAGDQFIGQLILVGYNFCPRGWTEAAGQTLQISQFTTLFALFGTSFGGDGVQNFNLPNLQSRVPIGQGQGSGLSPYIMGQQGGGENVTLNVQQMPAHTHQAQTSLIGSETDGSTGSPSGALLATAGQNIYASNAQADLPMSPSSLTTTIGAAGGNQPVTVLNPYLGMRWCVALQGIFPSQN